MDAPNYYAIIPANVRYDKELKANEKLLYGEITSLANINGYCWATNKYFSELYNTSIRTISAWINHLKEKGYISIELIYKENSKEIDKRKIYIVSSKPIEENFHTPIEENFHTPIEENFHTPIEENFQENNTSNNNKNIYSSNKETIEEIWAMYPNKKGKTKSLEYISKILKKISADELKRCVLRYSKEVRGKEKQFILNGSTFFHTRYADYLDSEYEDTNAESNDKSAKPSKQKYKPVLMEDM